MSTASTTRDFSSVRAVLLEERNDLLRSADSLAGGAATIASAQSSGDNTRQTLAEGDTLSVEMAVLKTQSEGVRAQIAEIDRALAAIDAGTYGDCAGCRNPIPVARLEARPRATRCVSCAA